LPIVTVPRSSSRQGFEPYGVGETVSLEEKAAEWDEGHLAGLVVVADWAAAQEALSHLIDNAFEFGRRLQGRGERRQRW
jgi:hypothetical protein